MPYIINPQIRENFRKSVNKGRGIYIGLRAELKKVAGLDSDNTFRKEIDKPNGRLTIVECVELIAKYLRADAIINNIDLEDIPPVLVEVNETTEVVPQE